MENQIKTHFTNGKADGILVQLNSKRAPKPFIVKLNDEEMEWGQAKKKKGTRLPSKVEAIAIAANLEIINDLIAKANGTPIEYYIGTNHGEGCGMFSMYWLNEKDFVNASDMNTYNFRFVQSL